MAAVIVPGDVRRARLETRELAALSALAFLLAATAAWWALALWPAPGDPPDWLSRARWVCFNVGDSGLPSAAGWLLLIGEPLGLGAALVITFKTSLRSGLRTLRSSEGGQFLIATVAALLMLAPPTPPHASSASPQAPHPRASRAPRPCPTHTRASIAPRRRSASSTNTAPASTSQRSAGTPP
ncbi:MAG: hypothetical protein FJ091_06345 [Deltaproteobacteria bacterium]|nr:hypothetical protein [Deltaproteobacteria bacterium]